MVPTVRESLDHLDPLAFVPMCDQWPVEMEADGIRPIDLNYRAEVDAIFKEIYREGRYHAMPQHNGPEVIELIGSRQQRLEQLNEAIERVKAARKPNGFESFGQ